MQRLNNLGVEDAVADGFINNRTEGGAPPAVRIGGGQTSIDRGVTLITLEIE